MATHVVGRVADIPPGARRRVVVDGRAITVFNVDGTFSALLDRCPHQGGSLARGDLVGLLESDEPGRYTWSRGGELVRCPWHGWEFDVTTGRSWCEPARTRVRTYPVRVEPADGARTPGPFRAETFPVHTTDDDQVVLVLPDAPFEARMIRVRIVSVATVAQDVRLLELRPPAGALPPFTAGAHIDLHLADSLVRSYSLVNDDRERHRYVVAVALDRASRGGSRHVHERLTAGDVLTVSAPRNRFPLHDDAAPAVLIAGGIGITPMMAMRHRLRATGAPWALYYCGRSRPALAFAAELAADPAVTLRLDDESAPGTFLDIERLVADAPAGTHFYCCGPAPMLAAFRRATAGVDPRLVHVEAFAPGRPAATGGEYDVELARTGVTLRVAKGTTILETVRAAGVDVPSDCGRGVCGTCETRVLDGVPDHRDEVLTPGEQAAGTTMMICCSGSRSDRLVLDR